MREELISSDTAKLSREKGFTAKVSTAYVFVSKEIRIQHSYLHNHNGLLASNPLKESNVSMIISAPTQSLLQRWLREVHNIIVSPYANASGYCVELHYSPERGGTHIKDLSSEGPNDSGCWGIYEEALETGLKEALKMING